MKASAIREKIGEGWVRAIVTIEVAGKPQEHVETSLNSYIENIKKDERIEIIQEEHEPAEEQEDGIFTAFTELEMLVETLETFTWLCVNFSPASIEIIEPEELPVDARDITNWLNDLLAKIHEISMDYRQKLAGNQHLTQAMNALIQNSIALSLKTGPKTEKELIQDTGVHQKQLNEFLKLLVKDEHIKKEGDTYSL